MSMQEQKKFISTIHPFDILTTPELEDLVNALDVVYFKANSIVQSQDSNPGFLYFILLLIMFKVYYLRIV